MGPRKSKPLNVPYIIDQHVQARKERSERSKESAEHNIQQSRDRMALSRGLIKSSREQYERLRANVPKKPGKPSR
jgi:hypothetical protein